MHATHYGRMCPIETPEGPNIGLIGSLASFATVDEFGFIRAPYRRVVKGKVTDEIVYLDASEEEATIVTPRRARSARSRSPRRTRPFDPKTGKFLNDQVLARTRGGDEVVSVPPEQVDYMDVNPTQLVSVATALIPFLEHDDANRALMGSNMQRQAVPLLTTEAPYVGTGMEFRAAVDTGDVILAERARPGRRRRRQRHRGRRRQGRGRRVLRWSSSRAPTRARSSTRSRIVDVGDKVDEGTVLADGSSTDNGELALGKNLLVAFMSWEGYNFEDAIILSRAPRQGRRALVGPHRGVRGRRPHHQAGRRRDHARHPQPLRGVAQGPGRARHRAHRRRGQLRRPAGRQGHAQGRDRAHRRREAHPRHLQGEGARGARHQPQGAARRGRQGHRRQDLQPREQRRAAAERQPARARVRRQEAQDRRGRQARRPARQQGRDLQDRARRGHAVPRRRHAGRHHPEPAGRAEPHEHRPGARDAPRLGRAPRLPGRRHAPERAGLRGLAGVRRRHARRDRRAAHPLDRRRRRQPGQVQDQREGTAGPALLGQGLALRRPQRRSASTTR